MSTANISATNTVPNFLPEGSARVPIQTLEQGDFLKLLVTQMTSQDPLNPQKDTEFIAQMAQFSALEQARSTQTEISRLRMQQEVLQADALLGQTVDIQKEDKTTTRGIVSSVNIEAGTPLVTVDGQHYNLDQVVMVMPTVIAA